MASTTARSRPWTRRWARCSGPSSARRCDDRTLVVLTSDHGESLGEHDYYFDHGENLFHPSLRVPLIVRAPGAPAGRRSAVFASTLDLVPTVLDAAKVSWPADLMGTSLLDVVEGRGEPRRERLFAQNDRNLGAAFDRSFKIIATPETDRTQFALYDRARDPGESNDVARARPQDAARAETGARALPGAVGPGVGPDCVPWWRDGPARGEMSPEACERLRALGYVVAGCE